MAGFGRGGMLGRGYVSDKLCLSKPVKIPQHPTRKDDGYEIVTLFICSASLRLGAQQHGG